MGLRHRSIRLRIFLLVAVPILSLIGLYVFAATLTASDALNLARSRTLKDTIGTPTGNLEAQIDAERLIAVVYLAAPVPSNLAGLRAQEAKTEQAQKAFTKAVGSAATTSSAAPAEKQAIAVLVRDTAGLAALRTGIASLAISRPRVISAYATINSAADDVLDQAILEESNVPLVTQSLALVRAGRAEELLLEEDSLLSGDAIAHTFSQADRQQFAELAGAHRSVYAQALADLEPAYRAYYAKDVNPQASAALVALENKVIADNHPGHVPPVPVVSWNLAVGTVSAGLSNASIQAATALTTQAQPVANATFLRLYLVGGLGLLAIILSVIISVWIGRGLVQQLAGLRRSALELANERLPGLVERLRAGQDVDVAAEAPPLESSADEIGQVQEAFNAVQRTAVEAAVDEARLRRGVSDVFRNLARRSQSLLHRQLALLDAMERRATEPEELEDLFRIDHLTTRMRRHSEGLIILSGASPGRSWRHPVPFVDVLRAAVAEVEDYTRIRVTTGTRAALAGPAVADVIHLIAELAENATIFSPPHTPVRVHGDVVGRGYAVEIEDRGLGLSDEKRAEINQNFAHPPQLDLSGSEQLGLFVAGQLASRHDIQIRLQDSPYGGTTAIVLIPNALVVSQGAYDTQVPAAAGERAFQLTGRRASLHAAAIAEPVALAQLSAATSTAEPRYGREDDAAPGPEDEVPTSSAGDLPAGFPGDPAAGFPGDPAAGFPGDPAAGPTVDLTGDLPAGSAGDLPADSPAAPAAGPTVDLTGELPAGSAGDLPAGPADDEPDDHGAEPTAGPAAAAAEPIGSIFTPRPPRATAPSPSGSFTLGGDGPPGSDVMDLRVSTTELTAMGLPIRVRQASLAPQLREDGSLPEGSAEGTPGAPSPEAVRSTMTALQRGWERGRNISAAVTPPPETMPDPDDSGNGGEQCDDE
jgi:signal transduction histidine kinase